MAFPYTVWFQDGSKRVVNATGIEDALATAKYEYGGEPTDAEMYDDSHFNRCEIPVRSYDYRGGKAED